MKIQFQLFILATLLAPLWTKYNQCGHELLEKCICGNQYIERDTKFVVNCTNTQFRKTDMLLVLPDNTNYLIFTGNYLDSLPVNIFGEDANLSKLEVIDMSNNAIREIKGKTFHHVNNVRRLILNHNNISIAEEDDKNFHHPRVFSNFENLEELHLTNAFADNTDSALADDLHDIFVNSNLTKLYKLHLEQNEIKSWKDDGVFCDLPNLHDLYLGDNNLPSLNFNILCLKQLRYLDLEHNDIIKFSDRDLAMLDALANDKIRSEPFNLEIGSNPLTCDAASKNLYSWLQKTNVQIRHKDMLQCVGTKYGKQYKVNLKQITETKHGKISKGLTVLLIVLTCVLLSLATSYVYLKKNSLKTKFSPMFEAITRKVHYTTIESQEV